MREDGARRAARLIEELVIEPLAKSGGQAKRRRLEEAKD
jgi:hypothetical protein